MEKETKNNLEEFASTTAQELNNNIVMSHEEIMQKMQEIKFAQEILTADEKNQLDIKNVKEKTKQQNESFIQKIESDKTHLKLETEKFELEKAKQKLEEQKFETKCSNDERDYQDRQIDKVETKKEIKKDRFFGFIKDVGHVVGGVAKGLGTAAISLAPVALFTICWSSDTYYERYENGIARHSAKDMLSNVLKPLPKIK